MSDPNTTQDYLNYITSEYVGQPDFAATITSVVSVLVQIQVLLASMIPIFDLDLTPVGNQLDIIGQWVGVSRQLETPVPGTGVFFTWDDAVIDGWDSGSWQGDSTEIIVLPDDTYLNLINAKIGINTWDGTTNGIYALWAIVLPQYNVLIFDGQNMSFVVAIQGTVPDALTQALITGGYFVPKPEGILISDYVMPIDTNPLFAWDCDSSSLAGWDTGSWGVFIAPT
jgi:hypothetical protein